MTRRWLAFLTAAVLVAVSASGCGGAGGGGSGGRVRVAGSTTLLALAQEAAVRFTGDDHGVDVQVQGGGSSAGITQLEQGVIDIANSSRDLLPEENRGGSLVDHRIAFDIIAIVVHPENPVTNLTTEQVRGVFTGRVRNWKEIGGPDREIVVVVRDEASGTREVFDEKVLGSTPARTVPSVPSAIESASNGVVREIVGSTEYAVGYLSYGYVNRLVKPVSLDGVAADIPNSVSGSYPVARYLHMFTRGQPEGAAREYIEFVLSDRFQQEVVGGEYVKVKDVSR